jgi:multicomponent Na+:H+ antiporter subunit D
MLTGIYPPELRSTNLDVDWVARRLVPRLARPVVAVVAVSWNAVLGLAGRGVLWLLALLRHLHGPASRLGEPWPIGATAFWAAILLALYLLFGFLELGYLEPG